MIATMDVHRRIGSAAVVSFLIGCIVPVPDLPGPTAEEVRSENRARLAQLEIGMPKNAALEVMGTERVQTYEYEMYDHIFDGKVGPVQKRVILGMLIQNPFRTETRRTHDGEDQLLIFYYTDRKRADSAITDDELTPLVFSQGKLIGWGWSFLTPDVERQTIELRVR